MGKRYCQGCYFLDGLLCLDRDCSRYSWLNRIAAWFYQIKWAIKQGVTIPKVG